MQDLRGSDKVGGKFDKNSNVFNTDWDFVIVDEAHEGTTTALGVVNKMHFAKTIIVTHRPVVNENCYGEKVYTLKVSGRLFEATVCGLFGLACKNKVGTYRQTFCESPISIGGEKFKTWAKS